MSTKAMYLIQNALIRPFLVAAGQTVKVNQSVIFSATIDQIQDSGGASDLAFGVARPNPADPGTGILPAGTLVEVILLGAVVVPMLVGVGGSTQGKKQILVATGVTDAPTATASGATVSATYGIAMQSGVAGDLIGVLLVPGNRIST